MNSLYKILNKKPRAILFLSLLVYAVAINFAHELYLNPVWEYFYFPYSKPGSPQILIILFLVILCSITMPTKISNASSIIILMMVVVIFVPTTVITVNLYPYEKNNHIDLVIVLALTICGISVGSQKKISKQNQVRNKIPSKKLQSFFMIAWFILTGILIAEYASIMKFSVGDAIYEQRAATFQGGALIVYTKSYYYGVICPALIALGMFSKKKLYFYAGLIGCIIMFMITAQKTIILMPLALIGLNSALKARQSFYQTSSFFVLFIAVLVFISIENFSENVFSGLIASEFVFRTLGIPGSQLYKYYNFFGENGFTLWSHIKGFNLFIDPPYLLSMHPSWPNLGNVVGDYNFGSSSINDNAHFFAADGVAAIGILGIPVIGVLILIWLREIDRISIAWPPRLAVLLMFPIANDLTNGSFFTMLLSFGGLFWLIAGRFFSTRDIHEDISKCQCVKTRIA